MIRNLHILVPNPVVLIIVPLPQPGSERAAILIHAFGEPVVREIELGCSVVTKPEEPAMMVGVRIYLVWKLFYSWVYGIDKFCDFWD